MVEIVELFPADSFMEPDEIMLKFKHSEIESN